MTTQITPKSWLSWDFTVANDSRPMADIALSQWRDMGELTAGDTTYRVRREAPFSKAFVLEGPEGLLVRAKKAGIVRHNFVIRHACRDYTLRQRSIWRPAFVLLDGSQEIGEIMPKSSFSRQATVNLPPALPLPLRLFLVWLTVMSWRQDAAVAGGC